MATRNPPTSITHFSHAHQLRLLNPQTFREILHCSACKIAATGAMYACTQCDFGLHFVCSQMHEELPDNSHGHPLALTIPTENSFSCGVCDKPGSNTWLYRCTTCQFDVHLTCAAILLPPTYGNANGAARTRKRDRLRAEARKWAERVGKLVSAGALVFGLVEGANGGGGGQDSTNQGGDGGGSEGPSPY